MNAETLKTEIIRLRQQAEQIAKLRREMVEELRKVEAEYSDRANRLVELTLTMGHQL